MEGKELSGRVESVFDHPADSFDQRRFTSVFALLLHDRAYQIHGSDPHESGHLREPLVTHLLLLKNESHFGSFVD